MSVKCKLLLEKKLKNEPLFPSDRDKQGKKFSKKDIQTNEWVEFELDIKETHELYSGLKKLYELEGKPNYGTTTYVKAEKSTKKLLSEICKNPLEIKRIFDVITSKNMLEKLEDENLKGFIYSTQLENLKRLAKKMKNNLNNDNEEFWQTLFKKDPWILSQIFACPLTLLKDKAYVGGKSIDNKGGGVCDFIYQNNISKNIALIEIKTPCTQIIGGKYRGTFTFTKEFIGAINQVINYRDNITKEYYNIGRSDSTRFKVIDPQCVVIIGQLSSLNDNQIEALDGYRNSLHNISILTFDELYKKVKDLVETISEC